jgi:hypothetical protein
LSEQRFVVRRHDPRRFRIVVAIGVVLALSLCVGLFELGHRAGGASSLSGDKRRQALRVEIARLQSDSQMMQEELARLRTSRDMDREAHVRLTEQLAASEAKVAELNEELAFYRRIVGPTDGHVGLRVQGFEISRNEVSNGYRIRLLLVQSPQRSGRAQGALGLSLHGTLHGEEASLALADLAAEATEYDFLYFQDLDLDVVLPAGFEPETAEIELRPGQRNARAVAASFPWKPRG